MVYSVRETIFDSRDDPRMWDFTLCNCSDLIVAQSHDRKRLSIQSHEFHFVCQRLIMDVHDRPDIARQ